MSGIDAPIRVLHVDDDEAMCETTAAVLERESEPIEVVTETTPQDALGRLDDADCVVSDYEMPGLNGLELLDEVRSVAPTVPFILFTGRGSEEIASDAIAAGVTDYLPKAGPDQYPVLANRVEHAVAERRATRAATETERQLSTLVENLPGIAYRCRNEPDWPMEFVSTGCLELTGYEAEALMSGTVQWGDIVHPDDRAAVWEAVQTVVDSDEDRFVIDYRIRDATGGVRWVWEQGCAVRDDDGDVLALEGVITEVTDSRRTRRRRDG